MPAPDTELIRGRDLPKLPKYLPRPVPPDIDAMLQRRFKSSGCIYQLGLLLMRNTGLRIGELRSLEYHCIRFDHHRPLLKVPLGKLNNERLVPLDDDSVELIRRLQSIAPRSRRSTARRERLHVRSRREFARRNSRRRAILHATPLRSSAQC